MPVSVQVRGVPSWVDAKRLLGPGEWSQQEATWSASLERSDAADVSARLRGVGLDGQPLEVDVRPSLKRSHIRAGRTRDARARRDRTPGFERAGTRLDDEGRMSLTPELIAMDMAQVVSGRSVLDACCGSGGNAIAFARAGCRVQTCEPSQTRLTDARHNARQYGVEPEIDFILGPVQPVLPGDKHLDLLFVDAPWGEDWNRLRTTLTDLPVLNDVLHADLSRFGAVWAKVPASFDTRECPGFQPQAWFGRRPGDFHRVKFVLLRRGL